MPWQQQWTYKVDGWDMNDNVSYFCFIPELQTIAQQRVILAPIDGDYPVYIRSQPMEGTYTFLIAIKAPTQPTWDARIRAVRNLFRPGVLHTCEVQARGMAVPEEFQFVVESLVADFRTHTVTVTTVAPKPVLA